MWLHLVVVKYCLVVQQGRNYGQFSSQMLEKLDEYAVLHILTSCHKCKKKHSVFRLFLLVTLI